MDVFVAKEIVVRPIRLLNVVGTRGALGVLDVARCDARDDGAGMGFGRIDEASRVDHGLGQDAEADGGLPLLARLCARSGFGPLLEECRKLGGARW